MVKQYTDVDFHQVSLSEASHAFSNLVQQVRKLCAVDVWPDRPKGACKSLYTLGSTCQSYGYLQRPEMPNQAQAAAYMYSYLQSQQSFDTFPAIPDVLLGIPEHLNVTMHWNRSLKEVAKGFTHMKIWRQQKQRPLAFQGVS